MLELRQELLADINSKCGRRKLPLLVLSIEMKVPHKGLHSQEFRK
jgi:hypothetical protein